MHYNVVAARHVRDHVVWVKFKDGTEGEIDLASEFGGPVFEPLMSVDYFSQLSVAQHGMIAWPNGADLAPEFLYERARVQA